MIEGQMDPAVVGKFKMTPLVSSMASDLKKAAEANDSVSLRPSARPPVLSLLFRAPGSLVLVPRNLFAIESFDAFPLDDHRRRSYFI